MPRPIKRFFLKTIIGCLHGIINLKAVFSCVFIKVLGRGTLVISRYIFQGPILLVYKIYRSFKLKIKSFFWLFQHQLSHPLASFKMSYLVIALLIISVTSFNFYTKNSLAASTTNDHGSLLFNLFMDEDEEIIEYADQQIDDFGLPTTYLQEEPALSQLPQTGEPVEEEDPTILAEGGSALTKPTIISEDKEGNARDQIIEYTVQPDDTISTIAESFNITINTILWANGLSYYAYIQPGQKLTIPPTSGILHKVAKNETLSAIVKKYHGDLEKTVEFNKLGSANNIAINDLIVIPDGQPSLKIVSPRSKTTAYISNIIPPPAAFVPEGLKMLWPTTDHKINQYYNWRHHGLDIDGDLSSPIYAADSGTVVRVGWGTGYGNMIDINHGDGKITRYGHCSKLFVKKGQVVVKGATIGMIGSTGWSTGPHVHFEVIINGSKKNPLGYIN